MVRGGNAVLLQDCSRHAQEPRRLGWLGGFALEVAELLELEVECFERHCVLLCWGLQRIGILGGITRPATNKGRFFARGGGFRLDQTRFAGGLLEFLR